MPNFVFFGSPNFAATILETLMDQTWRPTLVVTEPPKPTGRGNNLRLTAVHILADSAKISVATPATTPELLSVLEGQRSDFFLVAAYGKILPQSVLDLPRYGAINIHASLLPAYRGASPVQAVISKGETRTGITFMLMEAGLDTGPILQSFPVAIQPNDTTSSLTDRLAQIAAQTVIPTLRNFLTHKIMPQPQEEARASTTRKLTKENGEIRLTAISPRQLDRRIRAYTPWPGVYTLEFGKRLKILEGRLERVWYCITELQWAGKTAIDGKSFALAYPNILTKLPKTIKLGASFKKR
ncbi:methionyl-tRNA formyltransferase [Candidatus Berkelbacteria bacterium]|nr:methionyl-tRNA formyltransferase [Candidatus Berkelbacteria bacterium]